MECQSIQCTIKMGGMFAIDVGVKCVSGLVKTVNQCHMGVKWFLLPSLYHVTSLISCHVAWGKPFSHPN
jgi:hypothetical protein